MDAVPAPHPDPLPRGAAAPTWRSLLDEAPSRAAPALALGVELRQREPYSARSWAPRRVEAVTPRALAASQVDLTLGIRPLVRSDRTGEWIKGDASWNAVRRPGAPYDPAHARWFSDLARIALGARSLGPYADPGEWIRLDAVESPLLWPQLRAAAATGIPIIATAKHQEVVVAASAVATVDIAPDGDGLRLRARVLVDGAPIENAAVRAIGDHGLYAAAIDADPIVITIAPAELPSAAAALLPLTDGLAVPAQERAEFLRDAVPRLRRRATVTAAAGIRLPAQTDPVAVVTTEFGRDDVVDVRIEWSYPGLPRLPFAADGHRDRDVDAEAGVRAALEHAWGAALDVPFSGSVRLRGVDTAEFAGRVLPAWQELDGVRIEGDAPPRTYRELTGSPSVALTTVESSDPDWFDLGIIVTIDGRPIPFTPLFRALTLGRRKLLLADGAYFSLRHPALDRLKELIDEAAGMDEWETGPRVSRYQVAWWAEFEDLADQSDAAVAWRAFADGMRAETGVPARAAPGAIRATLRPYQQAGFEWLAFLWRHRLGGILADDMGLGKTLQLLTLMAHVREAGEQRPILVVAPTSVLPTWSAEAARFAPELTVRVVDRTATASGTRVTGNGPDVVLTSYAVLRIDEDDYAAVDWALVVLDEAQFAKNPKTRLHRALARLRADVVIAATGTPLENSLTDLWALLSLTSPGLFPSARRFREEYVTPIEQGKVPENAEGGPYRAARLARLRRRIRPLVLRRTKELVAPELPEKQEQQLRIGLDPAHRALYEKTLQRERQKVLGLLDDLDRTRFIVFRSLTLLRLMSLAPVLVDAKHAHIGSAKLDALLERVAEIVAEGHRVLVFSQFTSFLQLAAERLDAAGICHVYLDGATRRRAAVIEGFRRGDAAAFLISLKAGGFGLTLTEADYVFLLDPWWNPAAEAQAVDRAHRIGQDRRVLVYRLIAADTIEEKVMALQQRKARLFHSVVDDDAMFAQALTAEDIRGLLE